MKLPIPMDMLLHGKAVEWERLEFKAGWNPQDVLHTLCAFANDFHNWGGGYILIGVDEKDGQPVLPPAGIPPGRIEGIQKEILELGPRLIPDYHPIMSPYEVEGRMILVLWAGGGQTRPYKAPVSLKKDNREYAYYIRKGAATVRAKGHDETELLPLAATVPFDDRVNQTAKISDLRLGLIREKVIKHPDRPEATRRFNYPMAAIEGCLCNAIYHRRYETREPVEVRILPDRLTIGSFPGPDPSISDEDLKRMRFISRRYRNRRIGEFLKELDMTEGRGTGIPKALKAVYANESPAPVFHTDPDRTFFVVEFPLHPAFAGDLPAEATPQIARKVEAQEAQVEAQEAQVGLAKWQLDLLVSCSSGEKKGQELMRVVGYKSRTGNFKKGLQYLVEKKLLELTLPDKPNSRLQEYRLTAKGRGLLEKLVTAGRIEKSGMKRHAVYTR